MKKIVKKIGFGVIVVLLISIVFFAMQKDNEDIKDIKQEFIDSQINSESENNDEIDNEFEQDDEESVKENIQEEVIFL